ncbi:hypothetical protein E2C01_021183 [Portunus trituberculatus]|uniref:Uncharacterized protein n=1 Tax=Portunus trituberculatus TaxID=210409 RepID=A0A5B7E212_PORTR|nr:hypothetical protein [Portunus trituberculatus]
MATPNPAPESHSGEGTRNVPSLCGHRWEGPFSSQHRHKFCYVRDAVVWGKRPYLYALTTDFHPNCLLGKQVTSLTVGCDWVFVPLEWHWMTQCGQRRPNSAGGGSVKPRTAPQQEPKLSQHMHSTSSSEAKGIYKEQERPA